MHSVAYRKVRKATRHVLTALHSEPPGWTTVRPRREGSGYHLHSVNVTTATGWEEEPGEPCFYAP